MLKTECADRLPYTIEGGMKNMGGIGGIEIFIILVVALVIFGPQKLPEMGRSLGKAIREFKSAGTEIQDELTKAADEIDKDTEPNIKPPKAS
jgi:sec-independent protein translocase protein TatA